jgi:endonuclease-3 related protein
LDSFELLKRLKELGYIKEKRDERWWPNSGSFEVVVGVILTQQTKWEKVEKSLQNLREKGALNLDALSEIDAKELSTLIKPSGFYNTKAKRVKELCKNIKKEFGTFEDFKNNADREWLLSQKGVGFESADSILCYCCDREVMVVDSYTNRLLKEFGYEFEEYHDIQEWLVEGIEKNFQKVYDLYKKEIDLNTLFARFHGKIVEYCKEHLKRNRVDIGSIS